MATIAVSFSNVSLSFRKHIAVTNVLCDLNLTVRKACIYALIGPSGCGKTSLLRCAIGFLTPTKGNVSLFGFKPATPGSQIPGSNLGYMPQDIDLNDDLTIAEMLTYFGKLFRIESRILSQRIVELTTVLRLIDKNRLIATLSDGQKRRVCFAATIIHKPKLAILDEPTVGVDPLLREVIWNYMLDMQNKESITFLITTHYVDESKRANCVGFMRNGTIIAENSPSEFIAKYKVRCLQQIFAKLCEKQEMRPASVVQQRTVLEFNDCEETKTKIRKKCTHESWQQELNIFVVVITRIFLRVFKKKTFLLLFFVFEIVEFVVFASCFGRTPLQLNIGVVNEDISFQEDYSKAFIDDINANRSHILNMNFFSSFESAKEAIRKRRIHGFIHFRRFFSETLYNRFTFDVNLNESTIEESTIRYYGDLSNQVITVTIKRSLSAAFATIARKVLSDNEYPYSQYAYSPIAVDEIIYGEESKTDFFGAKKVMSPKMLVYFRYVHSLQISAFSLLREKNEKIFERNFAAGVTTTHIIIAHFVVNFCLTGITSLPFLLTSIHVFDIPCEGSVSTVYAFILLQIAAGVVTGMFLASLSDSLPLVTIFGVAFQFASLFLSGALWPHQSLPYFIAPFRYLVAFAVPNESIYNVMVKGLSFENSLVLNGFLYSLFYILTLFAVTSIIFTF